MDEATREEIELEAFEHEREGAEIAHQEAVARHEASE